MPLRSGESNSPQGESAPAPAPALTLAARIAIFVALSSLLVFSLLNVPLYLLLAADLKQYHPTDSALGEILANHELRLALIIPTGTLLMGGLSYALARREMRFISEITRALRRISSATMTERLAEPALPGELSELARAVNSLLGRLQDSFARLYGALSNLTHKLRTPITVLRGEAEVALSRERSAEELRLVLEGGLEEYERLTRLVNNIIFMARAESGRICPSCLDIYVREQIDGLLEYYTVLAEQKGITVQCEGDAVLFADPQLFRRAVGNVLINALTYNIPNGSVTISIAEDTGHGVTVTIADTGCGLQPDELSLVCDSFYHSYNTRYQDPGGTGLGLSITRCIMELHHGTVTLASEPGVGTTVILTFPTINLPAINQ